jgi:lipopolysaccharide/colanic/teichoic acid biosynthesis glycosyltransferase
VVGLLGDIWTIQGGRGEMAMGERGAVDNEIGFGIYGSWSENTLAQSAEDLLSLGVGLHAAGRGRLIWKRAIDVVGGSVALLLASPIMLTVAVAVKLSSPGPTFFVQRRVGRDGRPFSMLKFRSMRQGSHLRRDEHLHLDISDGPVFKAKDDPRVTGVGRFIRRLSLDELPQLFNVLRGDMSLVGPRPCLPEEFLLYTDRERQRILVKPGLTCTWQVNGRSDVDFGTWIAMDLAYISTWSILLDLKLLLLTIPAVLSRRGAY